MNILDFIAEIRESFYGAEYVYKNGSCFKFAELLRKMYGGSVVDLRGHCVLRLDNKLYDIGGEVVTDADISTLGLDPSSGNFYTNTHARFDAVLDGVDLVRLPMTPDQIQTIIVREAQLIRFGHDLSLVRYMIVEAINRYRTRIKFDIAIFDRELTEQERTHYSATYSVIVLNNGQDCLTFCLEKLV